MQSTKKQITAALIAIGLAAAVAGTVRAVSAEAPIADGGNSRKTALAEPWKRIGQGTGGMGGIGGTGGGFGGFGGTGGFGGMGGTGGTSPLHD